MVVIRKQGINYKALGYTVGIHVLLFLLFILLHSSTPIPPPVTIPEGGMEVNLGTSDEGSGHDQPMNTKAPAQYHATVVFKSAPAPVKVALPQPTLQSDDKDAPEVASAAKPVKKAVPAPVREPVPVHKEEKPRYTYPGDNGAGGNSAAQNKPGTSEGNGTGPGDKGVPSGTPGAPNYSGIPGNGNGGIGHNLHGRQIYPDHFEAEFNESGKVVIHVTVDRNGNIITKRIKTSSSAQLNNIAMQKINDVKFSKSNSPEPQQFGDVTIIFKTRH